MNYIDGYKLLDYNDIVESDHKGYLIDVAIEDYFSDDIGEWDNINKVMLNPAYRSHREMFFKSLEEQLDIYLLENNLCCMEVSCLNQEIE